MASNTTSRFRSIAPNLGAVLFKRPELQLVIQIEHVRMKRMHFPNGTLNPRLGTLNPRLQLVARNSGGIHHLRHLAIERASGSDALRGSKDRRLKRREHGSRGRTL